MAEGNVLSLYLRTQRYPKAKTCHDSLRCFSITSKARNSHLLHPQMARSTTDITQQAISAPRERPELFLAPLINLRNQAWRKEQGEEKEPEFFKLYLCLGRFFPHSVSFPLAFPGDPSPPGSTEWQGRGVFSCAQLSTGTVVL